MLRLISQNLHHSPTAKPAASTTGVLRLRVGDLNLECDIIPSYAAHFPVILSEPALEGYRHTVILRDGLPRMFETLP